DHVTVTNCANEGIRVNGTNPAPTISNTTVSSSNSNGIGLATGSSTITNCTLLSNGGYGINLTNGASGTISGCTFTNNSNYAIGAEPNTTLLNLLNLTATGNGGGTKNAIGYRGGGIGTNERWVNGSLWREITAGTTVNSGVTLTVDPGATVKFAN